MRTAESALASLTEAELLPTDPDAPELTGGYGQAERRAFTTIPEEIVHNAQQFGLTEHQRLCVWTWHMIRQSEAQAAQRWLNFIEKAAEAGEWQAAAWKLERRYPDTYGRKTRIEKTGPGGGPEQVEHSVKVYLPHNGRDDPNQLTVSSPPPALTDSSRPPSYNGDTGVDDIIDGEYEDD